ncbi:MAG: hypothetical protein WC108_00880 [Bacteroidales bacterium]|jgi:hypothetical protein|nr:hypothetical protein [Bacteroidales bacterium]MDD4001465.1 hypothetical protein [Bacteroidales bacterium]MDD4529169.1 hypothetical protein [Bacteroidales bacterium]MDD4829377.1 hypothetical protein [Bacteroidales bacterium]
MKHNYDTVELNADKTQRIKAQALVEEICDRFNLHNYFGIFSVVIDEAMDMIYNNPELPTDFKSDFVFEQCVNGACFTFKTNEQIFSTVSELIEMLTNEYNILDEGKTLELIFYVNGIDEDELKTRQNHFKVFFKNKTLPTQTTNKLHNTEL